MIASILAPILDSPWLPLAIFLARVTDVSIGTFRVISVTRGHRVLAAGLGFFEVAIWIIAASSVLGRLDHWINVVAWAGGFATGNLVGMWIEQLVALGTQTVTLISRGRAQAVAERLRFSGYAVTTLPGAGRDGPVAVCMAVVPRRQTSDVITVARSVDPDVVATVQDVRETTAGGRRSNPIEEQIAQAVGPRSKA